MWLLCRYRKIYSLNIFENRIIPLSCRNSFRSSVKKYAIIEIDTRHLFHVLTEEWNTQIICTLIQWYNFKDDYSLQNVFLTRIKKIWNRMQPQFRNAVFEWRDNERFAWITRREVTMQKKNSRIRNSAENLVFVSD